MFSNLDAPDESTRRCATFRRSRQMAGLCSNAAMNRQLSGGCLRAGRVTLACVLAAACAVGLAGCEAASDERVEPRTAAFSRIASLPLPATGDAAQPDLVLSASGDLLLSWVEPLDGGGHRLQLARRNAAAKDAAWRTSTIASGADWFVNWADTPHVWTLPDGSLWAHWLRKTGPGRMDYGIDLARSSDDGASWSAPRMVNLPDRPSDHGFVSFWTHGDARLGIAWLDSRQKSATPPTTHGHDAASDDHGHGGGPMMLRGGVFDAEVTPLADWPLDTSTCDCCPTASAMTSRGPVVVYRGRSAEEIRDIRIVRLEDGIWSTPRSVHDDGWKIAGCPVNGPAVAARGDDVWVAWYTEAEGQPSVRIAMSQDAGATFSVPLRIAEGADVMGRVALAATPEHVLVSWLQEHRDTGQSLHVARLDPSLQRFDTLQVATLQARGRASGNPRLVANAERAWLVWVDVDDGKPRLRGASLH